MSKKYCSTDEYVYPQHVYPVSGAATYEAKGAKVMMKPIGEFEWTTIQTCTTELSAAWSAAKWQKKENKAVLKSQNYI